MFISGGFYLRWKKKSESERVASGISNACQIGMALFEFETEYGSYPDESTAAMVKESTGTSMELEGVSSNPFLGS